ncbi:MAG: beta-lactamase family protein [Verrucomicrobiota bacterium]|nr:beta-lactamase family protein [Verrucomicrobiota bacterium]
MNLERIAGIFAENFERRGEVGAAVSVWKNGVEILSLVDGFADRARTIPWTQTTPVLIWSAGKGPAAACVLRAAKEAALSLGTKMAEFWPQFAQAGKANVTIGQAMSHQAGVAALDADVSVLESEAVIAALERQAPNWPLGTGHGYHPRTFGFLMDEIVCRLTGRSLAEYWQQFFAEPLGFDFWFGTPPDVFVAEMLPPKSMGRESEKEFYAALATPGSLTARAFRSPHGLARAAEMNSAEVRSRSLPAFGAIATASSLAKYYATLDLEVETITSGFDKVLQMETAFGAGFMKSAKFFGPSPRAFGHPGAGGSLGFADPENQIAFAYVMNQMAPGVMPNENSLLMVAALYE